MTIVRKERGQWKAGKSGNPKGRPAGTGKVAKLREDIAEHIPSIIKQLVTKAKEGDTQAAKLLLERVIPSIRPVDDVVNIKLPTSGGLAEQCQAIITTMAEGQLTTSQGSALINSLGTLARIKEIDELERRLTALEKTSEH